MATELGQAYIQIMPSAKGISGSIQKQLEPEATSAGKSAGNNIASTIKKVIVAAGIGKAIGAALTEGADLQQSLGGVETLFKESADKVKQYANEAYKTAGLSANDYMESVTSFSASLLQSLGGDTEKAAEKANTAMVDMSDNANKMGTSMESIQNAYQGFAKQNYTMLDNLKLGYGGTKTEMERLLADATELSGVKYDLNNLADVYDAIHVIQTELGITGTTAKESAETFSGSLASMKSAFSNFLGNLALGQDVTPSLQALAQTASTFLFGNFLPMVGNILKALPGAIVTFVQEATPYFLKAGTEFISQLATGVATAIPQLIDSALTTIITFVDMIAANLGTIVKAGITFIKSIVQGIVNSLPTLIEKVPTIINNFANAIYAQLPTILKAGVEIIIILIKGIINAIPTLVKNIPQIIMAIVNVITLYNWANLGKSVITKLGEGISSMKGNIGTVASNIANSIGTTITNIFKGGLSWGKGLITNIGQGFSSMLSYITTSISGLATSVINAIKGIFTGGFDVGKNLIQGLWNGIASVKDWILNSVGKFAGSILDGFKDKFGIASPSTVMAVFGKYLAEGLAQGIDDNAYKPLNAMLNIADGIAEYVKDGLDWIDNLADKIASFDAQDDDTKKESASNAKKKNNNIYNSNKDAINRISRDLDVDTGVATEMFKKMKGYAVGTPFVPEDQIALIHKGEAIIPAKYNPFSMGNGGATNTVNHTGVIRVEGVNNRNEVMSIVDIIMDQLRREVRV